MGDEPLIGIATSELRSPESVKQTPEGEPPHRELSVGLGYPRAIERAGGVPVVLPLLEEAGTGALLDRLDGICVAGGPDLDPGTYGQEPHSKLGPTEPSADRFELALTRTAAARGLPILGICRGAQVLNVALGGTLNQHLPDSRPKKRAIEHRQTEPGDATTHAVEVTPGSLLESCVGRRKTVVNSFHHQAVESLGTRLRAVAWAPDGVVEGIEAPGSAFVVGVQWHAEWLADRPEQAALFESFVNAARLAGFYRELSTA